MGQTVAKVETAPRVESAGEIGPGRMAPAAPVGAGVQLVECAGHCGDELIVRDCDGDPDECELDNARWTRTGGADWWCFGCQCESHEYARAAAEDSHQMYLESRGWRG